MSLSDLSQQPSQQAKETKTTSPRFARRPIPRQTEMGSRRRTFAMFAMALGGFGIGTTEFVAMGLLKYIAADFNVTEDTAGHIISAYALGVVVGAPLITTLTGKIPRRRLALILIIAFTVGNGLTVFAHNYELLVLSRFIAGLPHGAYFSVTALITASMAPPGKRGKSVALVSMGLSVATVIGVPVAQWLGGTFGWNLAFLLVTLIGVFTFVSLWFTVPHMTLMPKTNPITELGALVNSQVLLTLAIGTVGFGGMFAVYTYITWTLTERAGFNPSLMWIPLMVYGIGMVIGTYIGGILADRNLEYTICGVLVALIFILMFFRFASSNAPLAIITFGIVGMTGSILVPSLQMRLMDVAGDAQNLAAALNHSALNIANAAGAFVGGQVIAAGFGYAAPALAGAIMAACGVVVWIPTFLLRRRQLAAA